MEGKSCVSERREKIYSSRTSAKSTSLDDRARFTECLINVTFNAHNVINDTIFSSFLFHYNLSLSLPACSFFYKKKLDDDCVAVDGGELLEVEEEKKNCKKINRMNRGRV